MVADRAQDDDIKRLGERADAYLVITGYTQAEGDQGAIPILVRNLQAAIVGSVTNLMESKVSESGEHDRIIDITSEFLLLPQLGVVDQHIGGMLFLGYGVDVDISFVHVNLEDGSIRSTIVGFVTGAATVLALFTPGPWNAEFRFSQTIAHSECRSDLRISFSSVAYYKGLFDNLSETAIPKDRRHAEAIGRAQAANADTCLVQAMLRRGNGSKLHIDGVFGPQTFRAWMDYKAALAAPYTDKEALDQLKRDRRQEAGVIGIAIDAIAKLGETIPWPDPDA